MGVGGSPSRRPIGSMQRLVRQLHLELDGNTPELLEGKFDASVATTGVGLYTITFNEAYLRKPICLGSGAEADVSVAFDNVATGTVDVIVTDLAGLAKDAIVHLLINGYDTTDAI